MTRRPLTDTDREFMRETFDIIQISEEEGWPWVYNILDIPCLGETLEAYAASVGVEKQIGVKLPIKPNGCEQENGFVFLSAEDALGLADRLEQCRTSLNDLNEKFPWRWWLPDIWRWEEEFTLSATDIQEVIQALREAVDFVIYGPDNWPVPRPDPGFVAEPLDEGNWLVKIRLPYNLGWTEVFRYPGSGEPTWHVVELNASDVFDGWDKLRPALEAAVQQAIADGALDE